MPTRQQWVTLPENPTQISRMRPSNLLRHSKKVYILRLWPGQLQCKTRNIPHNYIFQDISYSNCNNCNLVSLNI